MFVIIRPLYNSFLNHPLVSILPTNSKYQLKAIVLHLVITSQKPMPKKFQKIFIMATQHHQYYCPMLRSYTPQNQELFLTVHKLSPTKEKRQSSSKIFIQVQCPWDNYVMIIVPSLSTKNNSKFSNKTNSSCRDNAARAVMVFGIYLLPLPTSKAYPQHPLQITSQQQLKRNAFQDISLEKHQKKHLLFQKILSMSSLDKTNLPMIWKITYMPHVFHLQKRLFLKQSVEIISLPGQD